MLTVARDPFARGEYARRSVGAGECKWCGQRRKVLYAYTWEPDGLRPSLPSRLGFCNLGCHNTYHS